jgi:hypothetical protein
MLNRNTTTRFHHVKPCFHHIYLPILGHETTATSPIRPNSPSIHCIVPCCASIPKPAPCPKIFRQICAAEHSINPRVQSISSSPVASPHIDNLWTFVVFSVGTSYFFHTICVCYFCRHEGGSYFGIYIRTGKSKVIYPLGVGILSDCNKFLL